jgi:hypothetical protein
VWRTKAGLAILRNVASVLPQVDFMLSCPSAVAENQPANKNRMNQELVSFASRLRELINGRDAALRRPDSAARCPYPEEDFNSLALELFALQLKFNPAYRKICEGRKLMPGAIEHWTEIPVVPTAIFKELELTSIPPAERTAVFHSSGTTEQKPSRHFHSLESLKLYEASLWNWFPANVAIGAPNSSSACFPPGIIRADPEIGVPLAKPFQLVILTPPRSQAPHSSLVHMFETIRQKFSAPESAFVGQIDAMGGWTLDFNALLTALNHSTLNSDKSRAGPQPSTVILGTAFSFVHLLDYLAEHNLSFRLPPGSRVMETGGYKNRSRSMPKTELHALITERLGVPPENILCEYSMSELSSQAYDSAVHLPSSILHPRVFRFPPWARAQIISPETGHEVAGGEQGLIRVFDLANVFSVMALQTEDLGIRRGDGFELIGRAALAEPRGCSLMTMEGSALSLSRFERDIDEAKPSKR